jgi:hypothetical protein
VGGDGLNAVWKGRRQGPLEAIVGQVEAPKAQVLDDLRGNESADVVAGQVYVGQSP